MERRFIPTEDGTLTLFLPAWQEHYHSIHGALQESLHIFIRAGLEYYIQEKLPDSPVRILEAGFGTGLNAYLSLMKAVSHPIYYHTLEKYPLSEPEFRQLNYARIIPFEAPELFEVLHVCPWEKDVLLTPHFTLHKQQADFRHVSFNSTYDIVYFDAFNPEVQPHLWTPEVLEHFYQALKPGGIFVTYCVKGIVKQALRKVGFTIKRLPGPPGKREILRACKPV